VVAEWGEGRIARLESETGARTPLVIERPPLCLVRGSSSNDGNNNNSSTTRTTAPAASTNPRIGRPTSLLYTPFGDLLFVERDRTCGASAVLRLRHAVHAVPLPSLRASRLAHSWTSVVRRDLQVDDSVDDDDDEESDNNNRKNKNNNFRLDLPEVLYKERNGVASIGGMALTEEWTSLYLTAKKEKGDVVLVKLPLVPSDDEEEEEGEEDRYDHEKDEENAGRGAANVAPAGPKIVFRLSEHVLSAKEGEGPGVIAVSRSGVVFWSVPGGVAIVDIASSAVLGRLDLPPATGDDDNGDGSPSSSTEVTSLTIGEDNYLYVTTRTRLYRILLREGPAKVPTNLVVKPATARRRRRKKTDKEPV